MKKWFFTFDKGARFQDYFVEVFAPSYIAARETMFFYYGKTWHMQYSRDEWFDSFYNKAAEYHLSYLETLFHSADVDAHIAEYEDKIKEYK